MITIVDYGLGNLLSIRNMLRRLGITSEITADLARIASADRIILPGVGHFAKGMENLHASGLIEVLNEQVLHHQRPVLGICLGMQLLSRFSEEGDAQGLGWIAADTRRFDRTRLEDHHKIPHMGWTDIHPAHESPLLRGIEAPRFYFVHSYHVICDHPEDVLATATHGYPVTCAVERGNILGVQFHPEKSHTYGMKLFTNFVTHY
ncbi:MAG: imidazole glycerol phosphate synthase subunit HisH [Bacteroidia bacterium]|nr:imidazole glycerol phosphate synthase subunit HisH [Bacteroidia bacterium]